MYLEFKTLNNVLIVSLEGELDHHNVEEVRTKIDDRLDRDAISKLIMDFSALNFMDSSGIGMIIGRYKRLNSKGGNLAIANVKSNLDKIFELSGIHKIIKLYDNIEEALENI